MSIESLDINQPGKLLGQQISREAVLSGGLCDIIENNQELEEAFAVLRRGYPDLELNQQTAGPEFRAAASIITDQIVAAAIKNLSELSKVTVVLPWRSALAFVSSFKKLNIDNFYHLSSKRDELTLETIVDFESGKIEAGNKVFIADPMIGTGNTIIDAIERLVGQEIKTEDIFVVAVVVAPLGVSRIKEVYPEVKIIVGSLDDGLDAQGYIYPGLGDFGDKYFSKFSTQELTELIDLLNLDAITEKKLRERMIKQAESV